LYIELIDLLRCPRVHEQSWLVAAFYKMEDRFVIEGRLGCPVCSASYAVSEGVADLREEQGSLDLIGETPPAENDEEVAMRVAAMLGLIKPGLVAVLAGMHGDLAGKVSELGNARVLALNPQTPQSRERENVAPVRSGARFPFAPASIDAVMLDRGSPESAVAESIRVLKPGGRLVADAGLALGGSLRELARDDRYVVAEYTGPLLSLSR
jgi:Methylase involved in ubiquinone/menaquinone biosynthesis